MELLTYSTTSSPAASRFIRSSSSSASARSSASSSSCSVWLTTSVTGRSPRSMNTISRSRSVSLQLTRMSTTAGDSVAAAARAGLGGPPPMPVCATGLSLFLPSCGALRPSAGSSSNSPWPWYALSAIIRSISMRFRVKPWSERWCVARMYASKPRASRSSSGSIPGPTGHHPSPPPGDGHASSYRVIIAMPMLDKKASCSETPMRFSVESPRREMSMRRVGMETPRSYASVATSANSCAAKRDPRRVARKATWRRRRISSVSDERSMSSPAPPAEDGAAPAASARRRDLAVIFNDARRTSR
mmetsp:Transcript_3622/g.15916  ORF Transcript_3622/g.15916 Transcript_3622/m.15916 type:complete len:302 (+) Transcript_3622:2237-3142(+)